MCDVHFERMFIVPGTKRGLRKDSVPTLHLTIGVGIEEVVASMIEETPATHSFPQAEVVQVESASLLCELTSSTSTSTQFGRKENEACECRDRGMPEHMLYLCPLADPEVERLRRRLRDADTAGMLRDRERTRLLGKLVDKVSLVEKSKHERRRQ